MPDLHQRAIAEQAHIASAARLRVSGVGWRFDNLKPHRHRARLYVADSRLRQRQFHFRLAAVESLKIARRFRSFAGIDVAQQAGIEQIVEEDNFSLPTVRCNCRREVFSPCR